MAEKNRLGLRRLTIKKLQSNASWNQKLRQGLVW